MPAPESVSQLIERFREHLDAYKSGSYNETQLRREFLDPFFVALGWDVFNTKGYAGDYKDVVHEAAIKIGGTTKAPDYSFRIGGQRKFFVEAKKPSVDVKGDPHPAYQLRRYAWTAGLPVSVLSDFEEFAVYDCRVKPSPRDKASTARILYMTFEEYNARWDEIEGVFSKDAILKGAFDKYASKQNRKRGTAEPDDEFLKLLEGWRSALAQNIARNNTLTVRQINHAVQLVIDRIVFLRICEDRGVEIAGTLKGLINGPKIYDRLLERFRHADAKYNSGLFHFHKETDREAPDTLTPSLEVGDKVLKDIIANLYYPDSPYELSVLPADILGHIYERFLGSIVTLSPTGKTAKVEEKPEVRKAGGVYYTPTYIVDYIIEHTVGELLKDRTLELKGRGKARGPAMNKPLRVLDPACGSGSFLLGAYDHLLKWHLRFYTDNDPESWAKLASPPIARKAIPDEKATHSDFKLTTQEKKRILTDHLFGVDIDAQAVEVTKLSLLLKVLEGENEETLQPLLFAKERALPDLSDNIRCGNSLIGSDFYAGQQGTMFDEEEQYRINAFDWDVAFKEIMASGGFEAVIGNPPWLMAGYHLKPTLPFLKQQFKTATGKFDLYYLFTEQALKLQSPEGLFGMIVPNKFFHTKAAAALRTLLAESGAVRSIVDFGASKVFANATNYSCIIVLDRAGSDGVSITEANADFEDLRSYKVESEALSRGLWNFHPVEQEALFDKIRAVSMRLRELVDRFGTGVQSGADRVLIVKREDTSIEPPIRRPVRRGRDVRRYRAEHALDHLVFPYEELRGEFSILTEESMCRYPKAWAYLQANKGRLGKRVWFGQTATELSGQWYGMVYLDSLAAFRRPHILTPSLSDRSNFALGDGHLFVTGTAGVTSVIPSSDAPMAIEYLLGLLNSRLLSLYATAHSPVFSGGFYKFSAPYLKQLPIRPIEFDDPDDVAQHDRMIELVKSMLEMNERLHGESSRKFTPQERRVLEGRIASTDREIDQLVYDLYGLTDDEIAIVEAATTT